MLKEGVSQWSQTLIKTQKTVYCQQAQLIIRNEFSIELSLKQENVLSVTAHVYNLSNWEAEAGGLQ